MLQPFLSGFSFPVFMTHAGDGTNRLWVVEKSGLIKLVINGAVRPTPFLDLRQHCQRRRRAGPARARLPPTVRDERPILRLLHREPADRRRPANVGNNTLAEYHVVASNPEIADPVPVRTLLSIPDSATNHNGGTIAFGQDGKLVRQHRRRGRR